MGRAGADRSWRHAADTIAPATFPPSSAGGLASRDVTGPSPHSRRDFLDLSVRALTGGIATLAGGAALAACGGDRNEAGSSSSTSPGKVAPYVLLQNFPSSGYAVTGAPQRLPFLIAGPDGAPLDTIDGSVELRLRPDAGRPITVTATPAGAGLPREFLPVEVTFSDPGVYEITGAYRGTELQASIEVGAAGSTKLPQRGQPLPAVHTPTAVDARGIDPICTRDPVCPLHEHDLAGSLAAGRPVAVLVSTPAYCQTAICGPVLDLLVGAVATAGDVDLIHAEVYANPHAVPTIAEATSAPIVAAYGMPFEPILFIADRAGTLVERHDSIFDSAQLEAALALARR